MRSVFLIILLTLLCSNAYAKDFCKRFPTDTAIECYTPTNLPPASGPTVGTAVTGGTAGSVLFVDGSGNLGQDNAGFYWDDSANLLRLTSTTEQLRIRYDSSNYFSTTVGSGGDVTFNSVGIDSAFTFNDAVNIVGAGLTLLLDNSANTTSVYSQTTNAGGYYNHGVESSAGGSLFTGGLAYASCFGSANATALQFATNNAVKMTILSGGDVGIGTAAPDQSLTIGDFTGTEAISIKTVNTGKSSLKLFDGNTLYGFTIENDGNLPTSIGGLNILRHNNSAGGVSALFINRGTGNVGFGTTVPLKSLDAVSNSTADFSLSIRGAIDANGEWTGVRFGYNGVTDEYQKGGIIFETIDAFARGNFHFALNTAASVANVTLADAKMTILSGGNVGIGTTAPGYTLEVRDVATNTIGGIVQTSAGGGYQYMRVTTLGGDAIFGVTNSTGASGATNGLAYATIVGSNNSTPLQLVTNDSVRLTVDTTGNVGIGTTAPDKVLEVNLGTADAFRLTYSDSDGSAATYFDTTLSSTGVVTLNAVGSAPAFTFSDGVSVPRGGAATFAKVGGAIFDYFTDVGNVGTGEDDLYSSTLDAAILATNGDKVIATYQGIFTGAAASTQELRAYFGGTKIYDSGALAIGVATNAWTMEVTLIRVSSTVVRCSVSISTDFATFFPYSAYTEVTGLTLTNTNILKLTGEAAGVGAANNQVVSKLANVSFLPAS